MPILNIENKIQLSELQKALEMQYDMLNDIVLNETVRSTAAVEELAKLSPDELYDELKERAETTDEYLESLIAVVELRCKLQAAIDQQNPRKVFANILK